MTKSLSLFGSVLCDLPLFAFTSLLEVLFLPILLTPAILHHTLSPVMSSRHQARIAVFMTALLAMSSASPYTSTHPTKDTMSTRDLVHYLVSQTYSGQSLLDGFSFFTAPDPSGMIDCYSLLNNNS